MFHVEPILKQPGEIMDYNIQKKTAIQGLFSVPGDKALTHRAILLHSLMEEKTMIKNISLCDDCKATIRCIEALGIQTQTDEASETIKIDGKGLYGYRQPAKPLDVGNSGTTMRILSGILAAQPFTTELTGDESLRHRPMQRLADPLNQMGAKIELFGATGTAPLTITGTSAVHGLKYNAPVASAQVKSAVLFCSLFTKEPVSYTEPLKSRNHTELMFKYHGIPVDIEQNCISTSDAKNIRPLLYQVGGDFSCAAYLIVAALLLEDSDITITNVNVNFTRTGLLTALKEMGGDIEILNRRNTCGEGVADIRVRSSHLHGIDIGGNIIPRMIDELPIFAIAALYAEGNSKISDAEELHYKESDRIKTLARELKKMGAAIEELPDGLAIQGGRPLEGTEIDPANDHRIALSLAVAAMLAEGTTKINNWECTRNSFSDFEDIIEHIR